MKKLLLFIFILLFYGISYAQTSGGGPFTHSPTLSVTDGVTTCYPYQISVGSMTSCTNGVATIATGGGGGSPGGIGTNLQYRLSSSTFGGITGSAVIGGNIGIGSLFPTSLLDIGVGTVTSGSYIYPPQNASKTIDTASLSLLSGGTAVLRGGDPQGISGSSSFITLSDNNSGNGYAEIGWDDSTGLIVLGDPANTGGPSDYLDAIRIYQSQPGLGIILSQDDQTNSTLNFRIDGDINPVGISSPNKFGHTLRISSENNNQPSGIQNPGNLILDSGINLSGTFGNIGIGTSGGNVGIGSLSPGQKLDVQGIIRSTNLIDTGIASGTQCLHANSVGAISGTGSDCGSVGGTNFWVRGGGNIGIGTAATNVGIGTINSLNNSLTIIGNIGIGTINGDSYVSTSAPNGGAIIYGNVGIGTIFPTNALSINGSINTLGNTNNSFINSTGGNLGIGTTLPSGIFEVGAQKFDVVGSNVGIGSIVPVGTLDINGNVTAFGGGTFITAGIAPTIANNDCGSTSQGTVVAHSTNQDGNITVGTLNVTSCAMTFNTAISFINAPFCICQDDTNVLGIKCNETTTKLTITSTTSMSGDVIGYHCGSTR